MSNNFKRSPIKRCFTLIELFIVLFIISFGIILTGVKIKDIYQEQRFFSETQQVMSHLAMAQDLMLIMDTDVQVKFAPDKESGQIQMWLEVEKSIEEPWADFIERKLSLAAIRLLEFNDTLVKELQLQFSLGKMSKGKLILFEGKQDKAQRKREFEIELLDYPSPIGKKALLKERTKSEKSELLYPVEVYEELYKDPNDKNSSP